MKTQPYSIEAPMKETIFSWRSSVICTLEIQRYIKPISSLFISIQLWLVFNPGWWLRGYIISSQAFNGKLHLFEFFANVTGEVDVLSAESFDSDGIAFVTSGTCVCSRHGNVSYRWKLIATRDVFRAASVNWRAQTVAAIVIVTASECHQKFTLAHYVTERHSLWPNLIQVWASNNYVSNIHFPQQARQFVLVTITSGDQSDGYD